MSGRVRPLSDAEKDKGSCWRVDGNTIVQCNPSNREPVRDSSYTLDNIFDESWTTAQIYRQTTEEIIKKVAHGINGTVFAYGQVRRPYGWMVGSGDKGACCVHASDS